MRLMKITAAQRDLLRAIKRCGDEGALGWGEVWDMYPWHTTETINSSLEMKNFDRVVDACKRRGFIVEDENGHVELTPAGRGVLGLPPLAPPATVEDPDAWRMLL